MLFNISQKIADGSCTTKSNKEKTLVDDEVFFNHNLIFSMLYLFHIVLIFRYREIKHSATIIAVFLHILDYVDSEID